MAPKASVGCIQRNPTKGIERLVLFLLHRMGILLFVAFKEIPQRELRAFWREPPPHRRKTQVAFKEIPQRELRVTVSTVLATIFWLEFLLHSKKSHKGN